MQFTTTDLVSLLGRWDGQAGPLYSQLSRALRRLLEGGHLPPGAALPAERQLARSLSVSRNTVSAAYAQLRTDGWLDARQGSATTVTSGRFSPVAAYKANGLFATLLRDHPDVMDLTIAVPEAAPVVVDVMSQPQRFGGDPPAVTAGHGYYPYGYPPLREALAQVLTGTGLVTSPEQLMVTSGAQQAISLAIRAVVRPRDEVLVEEVTFPGALDAIRWRGGNAIPVQMRGDGVDVDELHRFVAELTPRMAYLIPTFNNPTGSLLDGAARRHLARTIAETAITTIDDLTLADLDYRSPAPPPLAAIEPEAPIISVGSMSKVFWGGLRIGWLRAHPAVVEHLAGLKASADMGTSAPAQALAVPMLARYEETRAWRKEQLADSLEAATNAVDSLLPDWSWQMPAGGPHLWLEMPAGDAVAFSHIALRHGLALVAGSLLAARDEAGRGHVRLPLYPGPADLVAAIRLVAQTWSDFHAGKVA